MRYNIILLLFLIGVRCCLNVGEISMRKCNEYSQAVYSQKESPVLLRAPKKNTVSECGIVEVPLIVGGVQAQIKEFPHMAEIGFGISTNSEIAWQCGGALISKSFVLTAAHCMVSRERGPAQKVKLGVINLNSKENLQEIPVSERIAHPEHKPPVKYNDIGLLRLAYLVEFTPFVRPACLNTLSNIPQRSSIATGFGKTAYESMEGSNDLMKVQLQIIPTEQCNHHFLSPTERVSMPRGVIQSLLCAGVLTGGKDTCQGDSGGPLQVVLKIPYCMYSLIGVTSFGKFCGFPNTPALYTRVSEYVGWIEDMVWKLED